VRAEVEALSPVDSAVIPPSTRGNSATGNQKNDVNTQQRQEQHQKQQQQQQQQQEQQEQQLPGRRR
jgi:hypothetical protein